ncbi:MAG TPA: hypothetical protein VMB79_03315 [Jatrophihabitans sp.]|nr:hypothetical protein [Jatrophihabitans sp.]
MWRRGLAGRALLLLAVAAALLVAVPATRVAEARTPRDGQAAGARLSTDGYRWLDYYRSLGGLGPLVRDPALEAQEALHVRYLADDAQACETDVHDELTVPVAGCPANPHATAAGKLAATNSDVTRLDTPASDAIAVRNWFVSGFHALTLLEPRLRSTGYAAYDTPAPAGAGTLPYRFTAAVDVYRGRTGGYDGRLLAFPAPGAVSPLLSYRVGGESPEPFRDAVPGAPCHGWGTLRAVSAPIVVQWPVGTPAPSGAAVVTDLTTGRALPTCALTATDYPAGSLASTLLLGTNRVTEAALYYTDAPFQAGHRYRLTAGGRTLTDFRTTTGAS